MFPLKFWLCKHLIAEVFWGQCGVFVMQLPYVADPERSTGSILTIGSQTPSKLVFGCDGNHTWSCVNCSLWRYHCGCATKGSRVGLGRAGDLFTKSLSAWLAAAF